MPRPEWIRTERTTRPATPWRAFCWTTHPFAVGTSERAAVANLRDALAQMSRELDEYLSEHP